jgi:hypothetical protein
MKITGSKEVKNKKKKIIWSKTDHEFLGNETLQRYYRKIGDEIIGEKYVQPDQIKKSLKEAREQNQRIGSILLRQQSITEVQLAHVLARINHSIYVKDVSKYPGSLDYRVEEPANTNLYLLFQTGEKWVCAATSNAVEKDIHVLEEKGFTLNDRLVYTTVESIARAFQNQHNESLPKQIQTMLDKQQITQEQAVIAVENIDLVPNILNYMGFEDTEPR